MRFWLEDIALWYRVGGVRQLKFKNNKVNVVTGDSHTGKTAILQIFDYCLFASKSKLPESAINENVSWYGIRFHINDKTFTIARTSLQNGKVTAGYFFSPTGDLPVTPTATHDEATIKALMEHEFGIDRRVTIPYGGKNLRLGSKISLRFFLLFNTISEDIITSSSVFFDKQDDKRYAEALPRIFDLAVGVETIENTVLEEERSKLEVELNRLSRKLKRLSRLTDDFDSEQAALVRRAKELGILDPELSEEIAIDSLRNASSTEGSSTLTRVSSQSSEIQSEIALQTRVVRNLKLLRSEYEKYRKTLSEVEDSLKPIAFLSANLDKVVQTSVFRFLLSSLETDLGEVKRDIKSRVPIDTNIQGIIENRENEIASLQRKLDSLPQDVKSVESEREKFLFLGEARAKLEIYDNSGDSESDSTLTKRIEEVETRLATFPLIDVSQDRDMFIDLLEEIVQEYIELADSALANYMDYLPVFDYKEKQLRLRKPRTAYTENVGSSSNHMFLHLFLFLGLHEVMRIKKSRFVPPLLIIDQPSRPYWGDGENKKKTKLNDSDEEKVRRAFELLNHFVDRAPTERDGQCQIIVFEHVPPTTWQDLPHVHLVERFIDGNALIRMDEIGR